MPKQLLLAIFFMAIASSLLAQTPVINAKKRTATITIDGNLNESIWEVTTDVNKNIVGTSNNTVKYGVLWDSLYLYIAVSVTDAAKRNDSQNPWDDDAVEIYIDADNNGGTSYGTNDRQIMKEWNSTAIWEKSSKTTGITHAWANTATGYSIEMRIAWSNMNITNPATGFTIGFDVANDDDDNGAARESQKMWAGDGDNWRYPRYFGDLVLTSGDNQAPTAPAGLAASDITFTSLTLNWSASTDNVGVTGYDVFRNGTKINTSPVTTTTYAVSGLTPGTAYQFYVQAKDAAGNTSANSNTITATTLSDITAPSVPANLATTNITQSAVTLGWTASTDDIAVAGYNVYQDGVKANSTPVAATTYQVTGLTALNTYAFYVTAVDAAGNESGASNTVSATTPDTEAPSAPANVATSLITDSSFTLSWTASTDNIGVTGYYIYQDNSIIINDEPITATSYDITGLTQGTTYTYYVKAVDASGNLSAGSATVTVNTIDTEAPTAPTALSSSNVTATTLTLSWTAATDNKGVAGYDVYRDGVRINPATVTGTTYNVTALTAATTYSFYVQAKDVAGNLSPNSNTITVTTAVSTSCTGTGSIRYQKWNNISGTSVSNLTGNANYPNNPSVSGTLTSFEIPANSSDNYGMKVFGYICPPATGSYTFWIAADDNAELWLSTTSNAANKVRIAYHTSWTNSREWNKFTTQKSAAITLTAGQLYYVEALMKEGSQGDNMAVGWAKPGQGTTTPSEVIPGSQLVATMADTQPPAAPTNVNAINITSSGATITWTAATDNIGIAGYDVYRDGARINTALVSGTSYAVTGLAATTTYSFTIIAKDLAGNSSPASAAVSVTTLQPVPGSETFTQRTVIGNQRMPHDLVYGPDNNLWYTERFAGTVSFVNIATGAKTVVLSLGSKMQRSSGQDGLMGLALHPQFRQGKPYVYISYTYQVVSNTVRKIRVERYTYDSVAKTLGQPVTIQQDIPGSNDHNSCRLAIGPDLKLYFTIGDMGAGQFDNASRTNNAQNLDILEGKVLRFNTELTNNSWIPADNPFTNGSGVKTPVYTRGHRNPQGLVWGAVNGVNILYSSEHGPYSDDELNVIEAGRNYGWPQVAGFCDGNYNGRTIGGFAVISEQNNCAALNAKEPLRSLFPVSNPPDDATSNMTWPSTAPSGTEFYGSDAIPGWQHSLLVAQLKAGSIGRFKLSNDGLSIISDTIHYFRGKGRFRDVVVSPDGLKIYVACDSSGSTSGPTGGVTSTPANPGAILEFTYVPPVGGNNFRQLITQNLVPADDLRDRSIDIYPNPASQFIIVYNYAADKGRRIELIDLNGRVVKKQVATNLATRVSLDDVSNGLYILKITDTKGKMIRTEKMVVHK